MAKYIKPMLDTKFHVDFLWWKKQDQKFKVILKGQACSSCQESYDASENKTFDWVDPETGEVFQLNILWHLIYTHCSQQPEFIEGNMPLATAAFRTFIANNNTPLTPDEIFEKVQQKNPSLILRTIGGRTVYNGIRPVVMPV